MLSRHQATLLALFTVYAGEQAQVSAVLESATALSYGEWLTFCADMSIVDAEFTQREATLCFLWSRIRVPKESDEKDRRRMCNLRFEDFLEAITRLATCKCLPTDDEVADCGFEDGGQMLLALRKLPNEELAFKAARPQEWDSELRQPIWRCLHHLIALCVHTVTEVVHGSSSGDLKLSPKEVEAFKRIKHPPK